MEDFHSGKIILGWAVFCNIVKLTLHADINKDELQHH